MRHYKLKRSWDFGGGSGDGFPGEKFGRGSIAQALFRKELPDVIHFTGRRAQQLGCAIYDFVVAMEFEPAKRKGKVWVSCKGANLLKRHENKKLGDKSSV